MDQARSGAILPHAAVLLPEVTRRPPTPEVERVRAGARECARRLARQTLVVVSSRASASGIYREERGALNRAGVPNFEASAPRDDRLAATLREAWDRPSLEGPWDEAVTCGIALAGLGHRPLAVVGLAPTPNWQDDVVELAAALRSLDDPPAVAVFSHTGAGITTRAPLTELPGGARLEREMVLEMQRDAGSLKTFGPRLATEGGSSGGPGLSLIGHLFEGKPATVHAHEWPYGVGYLAASIGGGE